jgi:[ribosomal protein S18]-alanine N-acetyltransferase
VSGVVPGWAFRAVADIVWRPMHANDLDAVVPIEAMSHAAPWTRLNFSDALAAGYGAAVAQRGQGIAAYGIWMFAPGEAQLLNLTVHPSLRRHGLARDLLRRFLIDASRAGAEQAFLEVRVSNIAALTLYESEGFAAVARRAGYYPGPTANDAREDALVLRRRL